ncbi:MAG TPA: hypothetical protein VF099_04950 [Ktedonobacterales bacterium]
MRLLQIAGSGGVVGALAVPPKWVVILPAGVGQGRPRSAGILPAGAGKGACTAGCWPAGERRVGAAQAREVFRRTLAA